MGGVAINKSQRGHTRDRSGRRKEYNTVKNKATPAGSNAFETLQVPLQSMQGWKEREQTSMHPSKNDAAKNTLHADADKS